VVGFLTRMEGFLERAVEGGSRALFRQRLQPIELAKAAARAMQRQRLVGPDGIEVPNAFVIAMHPDDAAIHAPYRASLETRIARYLADFAEERGLVPVADITVTLLEDPAVRRWSVRIAASMTDAPVGPQTRPVRPIEPTAHLPRLERRAADASSFLHAPVLALEDGRRLSIRPGSFTLGRALDNDISIADSRVSRYHARLEFGPGGLLVRDLGSTNGTAIDGQQVAEGHLLAGGTLLLGGYRIDVHGSDTNRSAAAASGRR